MCEASQVMAVTPWDTPGENGQTFGKDDLFSNFIVPTLTARGATEVLSNFLGSASRATAQQLLNCFLKFWNFQSLP